jgi:SAM-dependent methyltransferase
VYSNYNAAIVGESKGMLEQIKYKYRVFCRYILPQLPRNTEASILDCGCGFGAYLLFLRDHGFNCVLGVDLSEDQIAAAHQMFKVYNSEVGDALVYLKNSTKKWDVVLMMDLVEHLSVEASIELIRIAYLHLNPGGKIIIMTPNAIAPFSPYLYGDLTHLRAYTVASLAQTGKLAGVADSLVVGVDPSGFNLKGVLHSTFMRWLVLPAMRLFCKIYYGWDLWGVYTANLIAVFKRPMN